MLSMALDSIIKLEENSSDLYIEITSLILKILDDIIRSPSDPKYRHIDLSNEKVTKVLLSGIGAMEFLFEIGFQEGDDSFILPFSANLEDISKNRDEIAFRRNKLMNRMNIAKLYPEQSISSSTMHPLLRRIFYYHNFVMDYEEPSLQKSARECIPLYDLERAASNKMREIQLYTKQNKKEDDISIQELLLVELVTWFKNSFFAWVDRPNCSKCKGETRFLEMSDRPCDLLESDRTELFVCDACNGAITPFHRYSDPRKLLQNRKGRCGEWASCFTLLCRSLGFDARLVIDVTDHVWTEVYVLTKNPHWVHVDPCEGVVDAPLMYEHGWGKKLSYIFSFSVDGVQDVTWRYSLLSPEELIRRRKKSDLAEKDLIDTILNLRRVRAKIFSVPKQKYLLRRTVTELVEFLWTPGKGKYQMKDEEKRGRISGSLAWRMSRFELGSNPEASKPFVWCLEEHEKSASNFIIKYSSSLDKYLRTVDNSTMEIKGWKNGIFETNHLFRKVETDWKMVYLARIEGADEGSMMLKVDLSSSELSVTSISLLCQSAVFESGMVTCVLCGGDVCIKVPCGKNTKPFVTTALNKAKVFTLEMKLAGGNGPLAWQHAQLFRQPLGEKLGYPLEIHIELKDSHQ